MVVLRTKIYGLEVFDRLQRAARDFPKEIRKALKRIVFWAEDDIKKQHYPGHGKITGTLQRSWHAKMKSDLLGTVETTPASMSASVEDPEVASIVFYAPKVDELYGFTANTAQRLPDVAKRIMEKAIKRLTDKTKG